MAEKTRKRRDFTLAEKKEIVNAAKKEPNQSKLARDFSEKWGCEFKRNTAKGILSQKEAISDAIYEGIERVDFLKPMSASR